MKHLTIILSNGQTANVPEGADPAAYRRLCEARLKPAKRKTTRTTKPTGKRSKRSSLAAMKSAVAWGIVETVKRVNGKAVASDEAIPFDGSGPADDQEGTEASIGLPSPF